MSRFCLAFLACAVFFMLAGPSIYIHAQNYPPLAPPPKPPSPPAPPPPPPQPVLVEQHRIPIGFRWLGIETDTAPMTQVRRALAGKGISAYREVGVQGGYALVFALTRQKNAEDFSTDEWSVWSVHLATGKSELLIKAGAMRFNQWVALHPPTDKSFERNELAIDYDECAEECDGCSKFTLLHLVPGRGWRTRWGQQVSTATGHPTPGVNECYGEPDAGSLGPVFAVLYGEGGSIEAVRWYRNREPQFDHTEDGHAVIKKDPKTGKNLVKITDDIWRYSVDPATGKESEEELSGAAARLMMRRLCLGRFPITLTPSLSGKDSELCRPYRPAPQAPEMP
ncbi:MAG: hypothetical protein P4L03_03370 [Terracidiphilus sp.]|nr:hypothetical protein [Terracidiphilus sp.]